MLADVYFDFTCEDIDICGLSTLFCMFNIHHKLKVETLLHSLLNCKYHSFFWFPSGWY